MNIVGDKVPLWWGTKNQDMAWGLCNNLNEKPQADEEEIRDGDGDHVGFTYSGQNTLYTFEFTPIEDAEGGDDIPTAREDLIGSLIDVIPAGKNQPVKCVIKEAEKRRERGKVATFSVTAGHYPKVVLEGGA